jgi:hypothetical protein
MTLEEKRVLRFQVGEWKAMHYLDWRSRSTQKEFLNTEVFLPAPACAVLGL